jgi:hypothetical protein
MNVRQVSGAKSELENGSFVGASRRAEYDPAYWQLFPIFGEKLPFRTRQFSRHSAIALFCFL